MSTVEPCRAGVGTAGTDRDRVLVACASACNRRGMERPGVRRLAEPIYHAYDDRFHRTLLDLPEPRSQEAGDPGFYDPERLLEEVVSSARAAGVRGIVVTHDYPGALVASAAAERLGLPGPSLASVVACQHKLLSRHLQRRVVPEATPRFARLLPPSGNGDGAVAGTAAPLPLELPVFAKPVRANFSFGARRVETSAELARHAARLALPEPYLRPLRWALARTAAEMPLAAVLDDLCPGTSRDGAGDVLVEEILRGDQVTLEAIAVAGDVHLVGIVDSHFLPGTLSFESFRYPSRLPAEVQERMLDVARRLVAGVGFDRGLFNVELVHDPATGAIRILEINPRMCSQFADLMEKVDGTSTYEHAVRLALGLPVEVRRGAGRWPAAASFALRASADLLARRVPTPEELTEAEERVGGVEAYVWIAEGQRLSGLAQVQDEDTWCYGRVNVGGEDERDLEAKRDRFLSRLPLELVPVG